MAKSADLLIVHWHKRWAKRAFECLQWNARRYTGGSPSMSAACRSSERSFYRSRWKAVMCRPCWNMCGEAHTWWTYTIDQLLSDLVDSSNLVTFPWKDWQPWWRCSYCSDCRHLLWIWKCNHGLPTFNRPMTGPHSFPTCSSVFNEDEDLWLVTPSSPHLFSLTDQCWQNSIILLFFSRYSSVWLLQVNG